MSERRHEETVWWCIVHRSISEAEDMTCRWDKLAGWRPGRGPCQNVWADIEVTWEVDDE